MSRNCARPNRLAGYPDRSPFSPFHRGSIGFAPVRRPKRSRSCSSHRRDDLFLASGSISARSRDTADDTSIECRLVGYRPLEPITRCDRNYSRRSSGEYDIGSNPVDCTVWYLLPLLCGVAISQFIPALTIILHQINSLSTSIDHIDSKLEFDFVEAPFLDATPRV